MNTQQDDDKPNPKIPHYPTNEQVRQFIKAMDGQSKRVFFDMRITLESNAGTPQETQDWSHPDLWIPQLLEGAQQDLALHIWRESGGVVNPRHLTGTWLLSSNYELFSVDSQDIIHLNNVGKDFILAPLGKTVQHIDYCEGLLHLLMIISEHGPGKRAQFMPAFSDFLEAYSSYRSTPGIHTAWYGRIKNLNDRDMVSRNWITYEITQKGLDYLKVAGSLLKFTGRETTTDQQVSIRQLINDQKNEVRKKLRQTLSEMDPYRVEYLVKRLLEAMEYEDVEVTSRGGDGGVDVVANIEVGITPVREVVQVKRHKSNIQRKILDELRGSLHRFDAMRGTIITTGKFSRGAQAAAFEKNAAPITLIDGERLIDLLIEYDIGIRKRSIQIIEFEPADFADDTAEI